MSVESVEYAKDEVQRALEDLQDSDQGSDEFVSNAEYLASVVEDLLKEI